MNASAQKHIAKAGEYLAKGDAFYRKAKPEIDAAYAEGATQQEIANGLASYGTVRTAKWVSEVLKWDGVGTLYGNDTDRRRMDMAKQVLRESEPEHIADFLADREIKTNLAAATRVHEFRQENQTGIPARNTSAGPTFIALVLKINGWLDELVGMVERGEAEVPAEFSTQSISDMGRKVMRLADLVDEVRDAEGVPTS